MTDTQAQPTTPVRTDIHDRPLPPRDLKRLAKPAFVTRCTPSTPEVEDALRGWAEPSHAYILFERWSMELNEDRERVRSNRLFIFNVEHRPEIFHRIEFFVRKGFRILHWGRFPRMDDSNKERMKLAAMHQNAWVHLESDLERLANQVNVKVENEKLMSENDALKKKLAEYEAKRSAASKSASTAAGSAKES